MNYKLVTAVVVGVIVAIPVAIMKIKRDRRDAERTHAAEEQVRKSFVQENTDPE